MKKRSIDPFTTFRNTERLCFRVRGKGDKGESVAARRQFSLDFTKDGDGHFLRTFWDGNKKCFDVVRANMFTNYGNKTYGSILLDFNNYMKIETGYIYE